LLFKEVESDNIIKGDILVLSKAAYSQENEDRKTKITSLISNLSKPKTTTAPSLIVSSILL